MGAHYVPGVRKHHPGPAFLTNGVSACDASGMSASLTVHESAFGSRVIDIDDAFPNAWSDKYHNAGAFLACVACGKRTSNKGQSLGVWIAGGGGTIVHPADYEIENAHEPGASMGWFPIGTECIKVLPVDWRAENPYDDKVRGV